MKPSPDTEAKGLLAYEQARAFERIRTWRLPASYTLFVAMVVAVGAIEWHLGRVLVARASAVMVIFLLVVSWLHWRRLSLRYEANVRLLAEMREKYGDELPWIQMEKHFAALDALKRELAEEKRAEGEV